MTDDVERKDTRKHCRKCELPKDACACADAAAYDNWWSQYGRRQYLERNS